MKNLLISLATLSLLTPTVSTLSNTQIKATNPNQQNEKQQYYWNSNQRSMEFVSNYGSETFSLFWAIIDMGSTNITNYHYFNIIDNNNSSYTKTSWGNTEYLGVHFNEFQNASISEYVKDKWVNGNSKSEVEANANIIMLLASDSSGLAAMETEQRIGLSYYWAGSNYLQIFGFQYAATWTSLSGGAMWMNIGQGIEIW